MFVDRSSCMRVDADDHSGSKNLKKKKRAEECNMIRDESRSVCIPSL